MRYKGKLLLEFTGEGIWFPYKGDELLRFWPWKRSHGIFRYYSTYLNKSFMKWFYYKEAYQEESFTKVEGFSFSEIITTWLKIKLRHGYFVVLYDINVSSKSNDFWIKIPSSSKRELVKDVVILKGKGDREIRSLCHSISTDFAKAIAVSNGEVLTDNEDLIE